MQKPLVLVPTSMERRNLDKLIQPAIQQCGGTLRLCGFGPVAAAARASQLLAELQPESVLLVGIAGAIGDRLTVGSAWSFDEVACYGVGVGTGNDFATADSLGWQQWSGDHVAAAGSTNDCDVLPLSSFAAKRSGKQRDKTMQLLTCCAGSACRNDVDLKTRWFPQAVAEDMEGYGVALACLMADVPLTIVRGISNVAGDRDKAHWQIDQALEAAADLVCRLIADHGVPG